MVSDINFASLPLPQALMFLKLQGNQLVALPQEKWTCRQLKTWISQKSLWQVNRVSVPGEALQCMCEPSHRPVGWHPCGLAERPWQSAVDRAAETIGMDLPVPEAGSLRGGGGRVSFSRGLSSARRQLTPCPDVVGLPRAVCVLIASFVRTPGRLDPGPRSATSS